MNTVVVANAERFAQGKSAMMTPLSDLDQYRLGGTWYRALHRFRQGTQVEEVNHFGRHHTTLGDVLAIRSEASGEIVCHVQVAEIMMAHTDSFTDEDIADLGFASVEALHEAQPALGSRAVWLMRVLPATGAANNTATAH